MRKASVFSVAFLMVGLVACGPGSAPPAVISDVAEPEVETEVPLSEPLRRVPPEELPPLWDDGDWASLRQALARSRRWFAGRPASQRFRFGEREVSAAVLRRGLEKLDSWLAADVSPERLGAEIVHAFDVYESIGGETGRVLVTGYYAPVLAASPKRTPDYQVPIKGPPGGSIRVDLGDFAPDLAGRRIAGRLRGNKLVPWPTRGEIRRGAEIGGKVIAWARDPVDLFFLEVQGSGTLQFPDGREMRIGYAGSNGRSYRSIGRLLIDEGKIEREKVSMQSIRAYLAAHPEDRDRILDHNSSVVFFRRLDGPPLGSLGVPVTPRRSIATDSRVFPRGALAFLISDVPAMAEDGTTIAERPLTRLVLNQDTGGAIRGPGRVDFFWGRGDEARERAGVMKQPGRLFFLVPKAADGD